MAPADAQVLWLSAKIPNDQFLVYAFDGVPADPQAAVDALRQRARGCAELALRVDDGRPWRYPRWRARDLDDGQFVSHAGSTWTECLDRIAGLADNQLDMTDFTWRIDIFAPVHDLPFGAGTATVAVVQIGHALADGLRSAALAGLLFGRPDIVPVVVPARSKGLLRAGVAAAAAHRDLQRDVDAGRIPPPAPPCPVRSVNTRPAGARILRTLVRRREQLSGPTVTVAALSAISTALSGYLAARGEDTSSLGAEVPMAKSGVRHANNHFGNVGVGLYPHLPDDERAARIAADLRDRRRRTSHPAFAAGDRAQAAVPARLARWGAQQFDPAVRSETVIGNTVVTSVNRGDADLRFGECPVLFTTGCPPLSPMMGLTHGVHGIGDTVAICVHAAASALADVDEYLDRLDAAL